MMSPQQDLKRVRRWIFGTVARPATLMFGLLLGWGWPPSPAAAQDLWITVSASPDPFQVTDTIEVTVSATWDTLSGDCVEESIYYPDYGTECWAASVDVEVEGDALWDSDSGNAMQGWGFWDFYDSDGPDEGAPLTYYGYVYLEFYSFYSPGGYDTWDYDYTTIYPGAPEIISHDGDELWWLNGSSNGGMTTEIELESTGGDETVWSVVQGDDKIQLSSGTGRFVTVTSTGSSFSGSEGDIRIVASLGDADSQQFQLTARKPLKLVPVQVQGSTGPDNRIRACPHPNHSGSVGGGYLTTISYKVLDTLNQQIPGIDVNERFSTSQQYESGFSQFNANWHLLVPSEGTWSANGSGNFADGIGFSGTGLNTMDPDTNCGATTAVDGWEQEWRVGSTTVGQGVHVQTNGLVRHLDQAEHTSVQSPP